MWVCSRAIGTPPIFRVIAPTTLCLMMAVVCAPILQGQTPIKYTSGTVAGVTVHRIVVNLENEKVKVRPVVARGNFPHTDEAFGSMVERAEPTAAINGTFFDKRTLKPIGDIVIDGHQIHEGLMGTAMAIKPNNEAIMRRVTWGHAEDWSDFESVLACGPTLVRDGEIDLHPDRERFKDPHVLGSGCRSACGLTAEGKLLLAAVPGAVSLHKLANVMLKLGCVDAMNLDGGASTGIYYRGRTIISPGRKLTNILAVYEDASQAPSFSPIQFHYHAAMRLKKKGKAHAAITHLHKALAADSDHVKSHWVLAWLYAQNDRPEAAVEEFKQVVELEAAGEMKKQAKEAIGRLQQRLDTDTAGQNR